MASNDWLVVRIPLAGDPSWTAIDATGAVAPLAVDQAGADLSALAAGRKVALLVPGTEVALFSVQLPPGNESRLQQLAPLALEEQVSEDLERLHFAVGARDGSGQVPVAVASVAQMRDWLAQAEALRLRPDALFAESDLAPLLPGHVTLLATADELVLRDDGGRPVTFPADDPDLALTTLLGPAADLSTVNLAVYASPEDWPSHEANLEALRERVASLKVQLYTGGLLDLYAQGTLQSAPVNLLQGAFKQQSRGATHWQRWRWAAILLVGLLLLQSAASLWELRQVRRATAEVDESITRVYATIFPGQRPGPQIRRALEARLKAAASGGSAQGELMPLLAAVAAARQNVPLAKLESMTFRPGALQLKMSAPSSDTLEQFSQALQAGGYGAQITSGSPSERGFEGQIDMKVAGT